MVICYKSAIQFRESVHSARLTAFPFSARHQVNVWLFRYCFCRCWHRRRRRFSFFFFKNCHFLQPLTRRIKGCGWSCYMIVLSERSFPRFAFDWAERGNAMATSSWWIKAVIGNRKTLWLYSLTNAHTHTCTRTHAPIHAHTHLIKREHKPEDNLLSSPTPLPAEQPLCTSSHSASTGGLKHGRHRPPDAPPSSTLISAVRSHSALITSWLIH